MTETYNVWLKQFSYSQNFGGYLPLPLDYIHICSNGSAPLNKMAIMPIYGKTLKNLLQN